MAHTRPRLSALLAVLVAVTIFPRPLAAYIDPLSGSIVLQVIAAGLLSVVFTMKRSVQWLGGRWSAIRNTFRRR